MELKEIRCKKCQRLLFKASPDTQGTIQLPCKKCGNLATFTLPFQQEPQPRVKVIHEGRKLQPARQSG